MQMNPYKTPGVYIEEEFLGPTAKLLTGVPAFLGFTEKVPEKSQGPESFSLTRWDEFGQKFGQPVPDGYLAYAVRGFFENGGRLCYVIPLKDSTKETLEDGLGALASLDTIDLVCAPDIMTSPAQAPILQQTVLHHCDKSGDCFAILNSLYGADLSRVHTQRQGLRGINGALYYPWVRVPDGPATGGLIPPCGHIAGIYARSDQRIGVHKAPANEVLEGVLDLEVKLTNTDQGELNPQGINCLRAFPGRGIRVWGARTLAGEENSESKYVNVRRLFLTVGRWIEHNMLGTVFEPNDPLLWSRITRELNAYLTDLFQQGALKGGNAQQGFRVKCDAETNPPEVRDAGMVVTEIYLAPTVPGEFIVVRIIHGADGVTITRKPLSTLGP